MVEALAKLFAERRKGKEAAVSPVIEETSDESPPRTLSRHLEANVEPATLTIAPRVNPSSQPREPRADS
jgi:hypothetical protein